MMQEGKTDSAVFLVCVQVASGAASAAEDSGGGGELCGRSLACRGPQGSRQLCAAPALQVSERCSHIAVNPFWE